MEEKKVDTKPEPTLNEDQKKVLRIASKMLLGMGFGLLAIWAVPDFIWELLAIPLAIAGAAILVLFAFNFIGSGSLEAMSWLQSARGKELLKERMKQEAKAS